MALLKPDARLAGAFLAACLLSAATWFHSTYMYSGGVDGVGTFVAREAVASQLRMAFAPLEERAVDKIRLEFDELRKDILARFDSDFAPDHESVPKGLVRDATYWWNLALSWDAEKASEQYRAEISERMHTKVVSPQELVGKLEAIFIGVSESFLYASYHVGDSVIKRSSIQSAAMSIQSGMVPPLDTFPKIAAAGLAANGARAFTRDALTRLTKYYVSQNDALLLAGHIGKEARAACGLSATLCKTAISHGYRITREGMKKAGIRIGATAAKAAGIANVVGIAVLSAEAYLMYQDYSKSLSSRTKELRADLNRGLETLIESYCGPEGEFRKQIRLVAQKVIEQRTSAWTFDT